MYKRKKHPQQSIKDKMLQLLAFTSIIPNLVLGVFVILLIRQNAIQNVDEQLVNNAMRVRDIITNQIENQKKDFNFWIDQSILLSYTSVDEVINNSEALEVSMHQFLGNKQTTMSLYLLFDTGEAIGTKDVPKSYVLPSFVDWGIFNAMEYDDQLIFYGGLSNEDVMRKSYSIGRKVLIGDKEAYVIMDVSPDYITNLLKSNNMTSYGESSFVMVNSNNMILYSDEPLNRGITLFDKALLAQKSDIRVVEDFVHDITFYASFDRNLNDDTSVRLAYIIGGSILLAGLLAFYNGIRISKTLSDPIIDLTEEIHSHQISGRIAAPKNRNEVDELRQQFGILMQQRDLSLSESIEKQKLLKEAEFKTLTSQIHPHFLYNTLESIKWKAKLKETDDIVLMVSKLGDILKASMDLSESIVSVEQEMHYIDSYLQIQKIRYGDRVNPIVIVEDEVKDIMIPKLILQPIVENAIIHGLEPLSEGGVIEIFGWLDEDNVYFTVCDNGVGSDFDFDEYIASSSPQRIGLVNVDRRLKLYYGDDYKLTWESEKGLGTIVHVVFPRKDIIEDV